MSRTGNKKKIKEYLDVNQAKVFSKTSARIVLQLDEYENITANYGEEVGISEIDDVLEIPGFFTIEFPDVGDSIDFFFPYNIYLHKTNDYTKDREKIQINFKKDELIFYANIKEGNTNIKVLKSLFENGVKYLGNKPDKLISAMWQQLLSTANVPWWHLEVIVSQLYGNYDKESKSILPLRLLNLPYSKKYIMNLKESAHDMNPTLPILYGYSKDAVRTMISKKRRGENSFFENIVSGNYDKMTEKK